jgi:hypothetical protein
MHQQNYKTPTFHIAYQPKSGRWRLLKGQHTHPAIFLSRENAIGYAEFRCPPEGGVIRVRDETGDIEEIPIEPHGDLHGYVDGRD